MMKTVDKLIHNVDRNNCRQKVLKVDKISFEKHYLFPSQKEFRAVALIASQWWY